MRLLAFALFTLVLAAPAYADDAATLQKAVRSALRSAKTFVATANIKPMLQAPMGASIVWTIQAPDRFRQVTHGDPSGDDDTIVIGHDVYGNKHGTWDVQTWDDALVSGFEGDVFDVVVVSAGDGTFVMKDPLGQSDRDTLSCTYDRKTSRPLVCSNDKKSITFARYDDPAVSVPVPQHAKRVDR